MFKRDTLELNCDWWMSSPWAIQAAHPRRCGFLKSSNCFSAQVGAMGVLGHDGDSGVKRSQTFIQVWIKDVTLFSLLSSNPHYAAYYSFCHIILYLYLTNGLSDSNLILRLTNSLYISILVCAPFHNLYKPIVYVVFYTLNLSYIHFLVESLTSHSQTLRKGLSRYKRTIL